MELPEEAAVELEELGYEVEMEVSGISIKKE